MPTTAYDIPTTAYVTILSVQYSQGLRRSGDLLLIFNGSFYGSCYWIERLYMWITLCPESS